MAVVIEKLNEELQSRLFQGPQHTIDRYKKNGKLLARERIQLLIDPDTPFLEIMPLCGCRETEDVTSVVGIGIVSGVECAISANVPTIKGGAINEVSGRKSGRMNEIAKVNKLPMILLVETAGANLTEQSKVFHHGGALFKEIARRSKLGIPTISVVFGSSTAGGAYMPGMSDYVVMVKKQAKAFLAGPPLVHMATGEIIDDETLGGAEMHSTKSGLSDYLAEDEHHAIYITRQIVQHLNFTKETPLPKEYYLPVEEPFYNPDEILGILNPDLKIGFDVREIIARIVDGSCFHEWKPKYGSTLVCCWANIHGFKVGILANNGVIFSDTANKGAHFIQICDKRAIPLLFLQNITGFMVGSKYEHEGIIKHGSKLINAVSNAAVPAITIIIGASYGAGNYAMCGRSYEPRFLFAWPHSKVAVMGSEQLVGVLLTVNKQAAERANRKFDQKQADILAKQFKQQVDAESESFHVSGLGLDDGIIDPRDTRDVLGICLSIIYNTTIKSGSSYGLSRM
eukprot:TRINITY_DN14701_c0_g1_i1.p1 TRINITY_DN14701_c0_g1~~TRINITY_DN14701_c0_g1_i1.p1  ORF type:complete len:538 (+),score=96.39 TRINITY_DN14701_c0_g1_i1:80-1615(+)